MIRTNIKVALRNLLRAKSYTLLNLCGLSASIACALTIFLYVRHELTYDDYHPKGARTYRMASIYTTNGERETAARSSPMVAELLRAEMPEIESTCRIRMMPRLRLSGSAWTGIQEKFFMADSSAIDMLSLRVLHGDPVSALAKANNVVLPRKMALKYFGKEDAVGDTLFVQNQFHFVVSAVIDELPDNTHHKFSGLVAYNTFERSARSPDVDQRLVLWLIQSYNFIRFKPGHSALDFYRRWPAFYDKYMRAVGEEVHETYFPLLEPIASTHMNPHRLAFDYFPTGNAVYVYAFSAVAAFLLLLACINYMNMATARSTTRAREVGLRKVLGSGRGSIALQFLGESILMSIGALLVALCMTEMVLALTPFNELMGKDLRLDLIADPAVGLLGLGLAVGLGILSGLYPAFFLSSFEPADALRGRGTRGRSALNLRKAMVVLQFSIAIAVIICTFLMRNQVEFMRNVDLGYQGENTFVVPVNDSMTYVSLPQIRRQIERIPHVTATTTANNVPGHSVGRMLMRYENGDSLREQMLDILVIGDDYLKGMGLELVKGRDFGPGSVTDSTADFLVNETAARELFGGEALGKRMVWGFEKSMFQRREGPVVGVVRDFTVHSLHFQRRPLVLLPAGDQGGFLHIRIDGDSITQTMAAIHRVWAPHEADGSPFNGFFIDHQFDRMYEADQRNSRLMGILAYICMAISGLGLIAFASYSIAQRRKEIGIRKVMGASSVRILLWLFTDIFYLVIISSLAGSILAFVVFRIWLGEFAYHAAVPSGTFFLTGVAALLLALLVVGFHSLRAALEPPVMALRYE
jgi:putative ABC transport system permease protein